MTLRLRVGTQLTVMILAFLAPIGIAYTMITAHSTADDFSRDLRAEARIAERALNASLTADVEQGKWDEVRHTTSVIFRKDLLLALLDESGRLRFAIRGFPIPIPALNRISAEIKSEGATEFMHRAQGRSWFCRIEPLGSGNSGYLVLAQDWTMPSSDGSWRLAESLLANLAFLLVATVGILLSARRYVTRPLAEVQTRLKNLGDSEVPERVPDGGKVELVSEEFGRINEQLTETHRRLLQGSERKLRLARRELNAHNLTAVAALASGFAHAVGTPLGVIRGRAEMILTGTFEQSEVWENLEIIIRQIDQISRMIRILLDLGRRRAAIRVASDVRAIADRAIQLLNPEAVRRGVEVIANLGSRSLVVDCDPDQLQQVFVNLGVNALDAMALVGGKLQVNSVADEFHGKVRLSFEDTGPGVPNAIRNRIFDPFFTTRSGQADGIGLAMSQSVIREHDGELTLEQHTRGACFVVTLPASGALELERPT